MPAKFDGLRRNRMKTLAWCPSSVGDAVMATPTLRALRERFPHSKITGLMSDDVADTLAGSPWFDRTLRHDSTGSGMLRPSYRLVRQLRRDRFDLAILFTRSFRSALICRLGGVRRIVGYANHACRFLLSDRLAPMKPKRNHPTPVIDEYLRLLEPLHILDAGRKMQVFLSSADIESGNRFWNQTRSLGKFPIVVLHPGSDLSPARCWPNESFAELSRRLVDEKKAHVIVVGSLNELKNAREIVDRSERSSNVSTLADAHSAVGLVKAIIARSHLVVSTDSSARHVAAALGVPVVTLFGPTKIERTETYYLDETRLQKSVPCGPCEQQVCPQEHHRCMRELSVDEVFQAVERQLGSRPRREYSRVA